jgi:hypothetical protein
MDRAAANAVHADGVRGRLAENLTLEDAGNSEITGDEKLSRIHLVPHLELTSETDFTVTQDWIFSGIQGTGSSTTRRNNWRYGDNREAGVLTVRAQGNVTVQSDIVDEAQDQVYLVFEPEKGDTWSYNLVAGADADAADPMAVKHGIGDLKVNDGYQIYTESGQIRFAAGNDVRLGTGGSRFGAGDLTCTMATYDGDILGKAGHDIVLTGASGTFAKPSAIQSHMGDIRLTAGGTVDLSDPGTAVRTLGKLTGEITLDQLLATYGNNARSWRPTYGGENWDGWKSSYGDTSGANDAFRRTLDQFIRNARNNNFWLYGGGGDISISAGQDILGNDFYNNGWMQLYEYRGESGADPGKYSAAYTNGERSPFSGIGTMAGGDIRINAGQDVDAPVALFSTGDLTLYAGGNLDGRYLVNEGQGSLTAMGSFGGKRADTVLEMGRASMDLRVQGDVALGTVLNPVFAAEEFRESLYIDYAEDSEIRVTALTGDLALSGHSRFHLEAEDFQKRLLPPRVALTAGRDVWIRNPQPQETFKLVLAPSAQGDLSVMAGHDIRADDEKQNYGWIIMSAAAPEMHYTHYLRPDGFVHSMAANADLTSPTYEGFSESYLAAFEEMWNELDDTGKVPFQGIFDRINSDLALHEKDLDTTPLSDPALEPVSIGAGRDIYGLNLGMPKAAEISAGGHIVDLHLKGQNNHGAHSASGYAGDVTSITAGGDIRLDIPLNEVLKSPDNPDISDTGIILRGPGWLVVHAGGSMDLGATQGIQTIGQGANDRLDAIGATVLTATGYDTAIFRDQTTGAWNPQGIVQFYTDLRDGGLVYSGLKQGRRTDPNQLRYDTALGIWVPETYAVDLAWVRSLSTLYSWAQDLVVEDLIGFYGTYEDVPPEIRDDLAERVVNALRANMIDPFLATSAAFQAASGEPASQIPLPEMGIDFDRPLSAGGISMVQSQVLTQNGGSIYMMAMDDLDVGLTAFGGDSKRQSGINAQFSGDIGVFTEGDINVNESRIMTWYGGDIILWSDAGSINAGKGSKTTVSLASREKRYDELLERWVPKNSPPAVGSGIRLLTHDPDGVFGPQVTANPGNGYLFAPDGEIDAGEAGIAGRGLLLFEAQRLVNVQNIESVGISIGVSAQGDAGSDIGSFSGGSFNETAKVNENAGVMKSSRKRFKEMVQAMNDSLVPRWLAVEVTGFGDLQEGQDAEEGKQGGCGGLTGAALEQCLERQGQ